MKEWRKFLVASRDTAKTNGVAGRKYRPDSVRQRLYEAFELVFETRDAAAAVH